MTQNKHNKLDDSTNSTDTDASLISAQLKAANNMINRINQGHDFGVVIGLDIETALYRTAQELRINAIIQPLREAFIFKGTSINIINGTSLIEHIKDTGNTLYPFGLSTLPPATDKQKTEILNQLNKIFDRVNIVSDLLGNDSSHNNEQPEDFLKFINSINFKDIIDTEASEA